MGKTAVELFMIFWFGYTLLMVGIIVAVIVWARKNKQFSHQDRAARLPLEIEDGFSNSEKRKSRFLITGK